MDTALQDEAQPSSSARLTDQPEEPIPELPPTIVPGRIGNFPAEPLGGDSILSPNRNATPARESGSSLTVITQDQIRQSGQNTVMEVLRGQLGVDVVRQGGPGGLSSVFLRGANSQHTKVLLDGIPLNDPSGATRAFDFSNLTVDNIERIEILRGPQSMVYGSDAIGGVVNIITQRGDGPLSIRAGGMGGELQHWPDRTHRQRRRRTKVLLGDRLVPQHWRNLRCQRPKRQHGARLLQQRHGLRPAGI